MISHFILYVHDQEKSTNFYKTVLKQDPILQVPGMTEFALSKDCILGLMPARGIKRLLGDALPDPDKGQEISRAELYLHVEDPSTFHKRAVDAGAKELSALQQRDWGAVVAYSLDPDGYVIAFAKRGELNE